MTSWAKKNKLVLAQFDKDNLGGVYACGSYIFVVVQESKEHWQTVDTIIHESVHVVEKAMQYIQESVIGEEVRAYTTASVAVNLLKDFQERRENALHEAGKA